MIKRSVWKFPYIHLYNVKYGKIYNRNFTITSSLVDKRISFHRGNRWNNMNVTERFLNHKIGEFCINKVFGGRFAYRKKLKKKKKMMNKKKK